MTTTIVSTDTTYSGGPFTPATSGDSYILLPNAVAMNPTGIVLYAPSTLTNLSFNLNGIVVSGSVTAVWLEGATSRVVVGSTGRVYAEHPLSPNAVILLSGSDSSLANAGEIVTGSGSGFQALGERVSVTNSGLISGSYAGVNLQGNGDTVTNSGTIEATGSNGYGVVGSFATVSIFNSGTITGGTNSVPGFFLAAGILVANNCAARIVNQGTIATSSSHGIRTISTGSLDLTNLGLISGVIGVEGGGLADRIINTGTIVGDVLLGDGDDLFRTDTVLLQIVEAIGGGVADRVESTVDFDLTTTANVENLTLIAAAQRGYGNALANTLAGNGVNNVMLGRDGADTVTGGAGDDRMRGDGGDDLVQGDEGDDLVRGGAGADTVYGGEGDDTLTGDAAGDRLFGDDGDDVLTGGAGRDTLYGGADADSFVFRFATDSAVGSTLRDLIVGFETGLDLIDLRQMDASSLLTGNQAFTFIGTGAFTSVAGQLRAIHGTSSVIQGDVNGDGVADFELQLNGIATVNVNDILL
jgi:Ca2+-binding RTX toxin-like protein